MKNLSVSILLLLSVSAYAQISLDFETNNLYIYQNHLNNSETKYLYWKLGEYHFTLYNLNYTLYKTITIPTGPDTSAIPVVLDYVSTTLFDNDPTSIEYIINFMGDSSGYAYRQTKVIREDGTVLLDEMNAENCGYIYGTEEGSKILLRYRYANDHPYQIKVFSLPGDPPIAMKEPQKKDDLLIFPNPNSGIGSLKINYLGEQENLITIFSSEGKLIDSFQTYEEVSHFNYSTLPNGIYLITVLSKNRTSKQKMIISVQLK